MPSVKRSSFYHPEVDVCPVTACQKVLNSSYTMTICQQLAFLFFFLKKCKKLVPVNTYVIASSLFSLLMKKAAYHITEKPTATSVSQLVLHDSCAVIENESSNHH